jgi:hypothetical protein
MASLLGGGPLWAATRDTTRLRNRKGEQLLGLPTSRGPTHAAWA